MFKLLIFVAMFFASLTSYAGENISLRNNSTASAYQDLEALPYSFAVIHGEYGSVKLFSPKNSAENYANMRIVLMEPGFAVIIDSATCKDGMDTKLEQFFKNEGFNLVRSIKRNLTKNTEIVELRFVKIGKRVVFVD